VHLGALHHGAPRGRDSPFTSNHSRHALVSSLRFCEPITTGFGPLHGMTALGDIQTSAIPGHSAEVFVLHYFGTLPCLSLLGCPLTPHDRCAPCTGLILPASSSYFWVICTNILRGFQAKSPRLHTLPCCRVCILGIHHDACVRSTTFDIEQRKIRATVNLTRIQIHLLGSCFYG
jgi:hypothetical protein